MKFGKKLRDTVEKAPAEWKNLFIDYKGLKKFLKNEVREDNQHDPENVCGVATARAPTNGVEATLTLKGTVPTLSSGESPRNLVGSHGVIPQIEQVTARDPLFPGFGAQPRAQRKRPRFSTSPPLSSNADSDSDTDLSEAPPLELLERINKERIPREHDKHGFFDLLHQELDKVNEFFLEQLEDLIIRSEIIQREFGKFLSGCKSKKSFGAGELESLSSRLKRLHDDLVLLQNYAAVNYLGFRKALKKYDKKSGTRLRRTYLAGVLRTPFFLQSENLRSMTIEADRRLNLLNHLSFSQKNSSEVELPESTPLPFRATDYAYETPQVLTLGQSLERKPAKESNALQNDGLSASPSEKNHQETAVHHF